jgi:hypothetical protein
MTFNNNSDQKERRAIIKNDAATLHQFAQSEANEISGRWAKPQTVNASRPVVNYPAGPNWSVDPTGPEPPLNQDVNAMEPCGQPWEVEASLDRNFGLQRSLQDGAPPSAGSLIPAALEPAPDSEVARANSDEEPARQPLPLSGRHSINPDRGARVSPTNSIKRRLR